MPVQRKYRGRYSVARGDIYLKGSNADFIASTEDGEQFVLIFENHPKHGKATIIEYDPYDYPAFTLVVTANWKARLFKNEVIRNKVYTHIR